MKKLNISILSMAMVLGLGLTSCGGKQSNEPSKELGSVIKTKQDVYAYSMFSSSTLLSNLNPTGVASLANENASVVTDAEVKKINDYVAMFNGLLESKGIDQTTEVNKDEAYKEFETKVTVKENGKTFVSYLNETAKNVEEEGKEDDDEIEIDTKLEGIMLEIGEDNNPVAYYLVNGSKEVEEETEGNEVEKEVEIEMTTKLAEKDAEGNLVEVEGAKTVTVKQEIEKEIENGVEENEQSFKYTVKDGNGKIIESECSKVEIEEEKGEVEISLTLGHNEDTAKIYEFSKKGDVLEVEVFEGEDNIVESFEIKSEVLEDGTIKNTYIFKDRTQEEIDD